MTSEPTRSPARVLIVDNDADVADVLSVFLSRSGGVEVLRAAEGALALDVVDAERAAGRELGAIILDLRMPGMDGLQVLAKLEALDRAPRVVVLTGFVDDDDAQRLRASPLVQGIVRKPCDLAQLLVVVREAIAGSVAGRPAAEGILPLERVVRAPKD